jgi:hypothetical protein
MIGMAYSLSAPSLRFASGTSLTRTASEGLSSAPSHDDDDGGDEDTPEAPEDEPDHVCPPDCENRRNLATETVRRIGERPTATLACLGPMPNPYLEEERILDTYADDAGNEYWFDAKTGTLVQMGPRADSHPPAHAARPATAPLPVKELREKAVAIAAAMNKKFAARRSSLHPLEDNRRRQTYYFRWDDFNAPLKESELPPFIQVALAAEGRLVGFTDTLHD